MKKRRLLTLLFLIFSLTGCAPRVPHNKVTVVESKAMEAISQAKMGKLCSPIKLTYRKLEVKEISDHLGMDVEHTMAHLRATNIHGYYSLSANNYPPGQEFILYQVDLANNVHPIKTFYVNQNGRLVTPLDDLQVDLENNFVFFSNYLPGEPIEFVLGSKDKRYFAAVCIIPNPIITRDDHKRTLSIQIDSADRRQYLIHGTGFEPFASYMMVSTFENEKFIYTVTSNENGEIFQPSGPTVPWIRGGDGSIELRGNELTKPLILDFQWGF